MPLTMMNRFFPQELISEMPKFEYEHGKIVGDDPYRVGLKLEIGWVYAEGLNHFELDEHGRLLLAGLDSTGKLAVALQISLQPFE